VNAHCVSRVYRRDKKHRDTSAKGSHPNGCSATSFGFPVSQHQSRNVARDR
jgi:hypothetical protein